MPGFLLMGLRCESGSCRDASATESGDVAIRQITRVIMSVRDLGRLQRLRSVGADTRFLPQPHVIDQPPGQLRELPCFDNIVK